MICCGYNSRLISFTFSARSDGSEPSLRALNVNGRTNKGDSTMTDTINRRHFLGATAAAGVAASLAGSAQAGTQNGGANNRLVVGIMGTGGRGTGLATTFQQQPNVEVAYV